MAPNDPETSPTPTRVVLLLDGVEACVARADQGGWTEEERARYDAITDPQRKAQFLVGHWRVRGLASLVFGGAPEDWRWWRTPGEPARLLDTMRNLGCYASLSHAGDMVACTVSDDVVGVDIEMIRLERELPTLARRCLAPDEAAAVAGLEGIPQAEAFYHGWAIREALGKAAGTGLVPGTARRMRIVPADVADASLRVWQMADRVLALAFSPGANVEAHGRLEAVPEHLGWEFFA
jgi:4'-phosphopantetheinyl transferase